MHWHMVECRDSAAAAVMVELTQNSAQTVPANQPLTSALGPGHRRIDTHAALLDGSSIHLVAAVFAVPPSDRQLITISHVRTFNKIHTNYFLIAWVMQLAVQLDAKGRTQQFTNLMTLEGFRAYLHSREAQTDLAELGEYWGTCGAVVNPVTGQRDEDPFRPASAKKPRLSNVNVSRHIAEFSMVLVLLSFEESWPTVRTHTNTACCSSHLFCFLLLSSGRSHCHALFWCL